MFQAIWLNAVVPGHTRGAITLPGGECCTEVASHPVVAQETGAKCCPPREHVAGSHSGKIPTSDQRARCAICFFAATMTPSPVVNLTPPPLELQALLPVAAPEVGTSGDLLVTYLGRAPPAAV